MRIAMTIQLSWSTRPRVAVFLMLAVTSAGKTAIPQYFEFSLIGCWKFISEIPTRLNALL